MIKLKQMMYILAFFNFQTNKHFVNHFLSIPEIILSNKSNDFQILVIAAIQ